MDGALTTYGGLKVGPDGDIELIDEEEEYIQRILVRLRSHSSDFLLHPEVCMDLENFMGEWLKPETLRALERRVSTSLASSNIFPTRLLTVEAIEARDNVVVLVIDYGGDRNLVVPFSYREGFLMPGSLTDEGRLIDAYSYG